MKKRNQYTAELKQNASETPSREGNIKPSGLEVPIEPANAQSAEKRFYQRRCSRIKTKPGNSINK